MRDAHETLHALVMVTNHKHKGESAMAMITIDTEQLESMIEAAILKHERAALAARMNEPSLPDEGIDLWNRFDHESGDNAESTLWQIVGLLGVLTHVADVRIESCTNAREAALWRAYLAVYNGNNAEAQRLFEEA